MFRLLAAAAFALMTVPAALSAEAFDEETAYKAWKANFLHCSESADPAACEASTYAIQEGLEQRGWCWVAYDQDMMRPGSSRYLNEHFGVATCPLKKN